MTSQGSTMLSHLSGRRRRQWQEAALAYLFLLPTLIGLLFLTLGPVVAGFLVSFTNWNILLPPQWVGLTNYRALATQDLPLRVLGHTLYYTVINVPLNMAVALAVALVLNQKLQIGRAH